MTKAPDIMYVLIKDGEQIFKPDSRKEVVVMQAYEHAIAARFSPDFLGDKSPAKLLAGYEIGEIRNEKQ